MPTTGNLAVSWDERIAEFVGRIRALQLAPDWTALLAASRDESDAGVPLLTLKNQVERELLELADQIALLLAELPPVNIAHRAPNYRPGLGVRSIPENEMNARRHELLVSLGEQINEVRVFNATILGLVQGSAMQWRHDGPRIKSAGAVAEGRVKAKQSREERHQQKREAVRQLAERLINEGEERTKVNALIAKKWNMSRKQIANLRK